MYNDVKESHVNRDSSLSNAYIFYNLKTALYSSAVVMKGFTNSRKLF